VPFERISINPNICHGQACVKGTRIPVHQIVRTLSRSLLSAGSWAPEDMRLTRSACCVPTL
jgi:hypothetical protein